MLWSRPSVKAGSPVDGATDHLDLPKALLEALGDDPSRRILNSAIAAGKTVEEMSAEQGLPLSTCYRKVRGLLDEGLMILERMVVTQTGKRYAVYRTSILEAKISFNDGAVDIQVTPNPDVLDKLRRRWLSAAYEPQAHQDTGAAVNPGERSLNRHSSGPFE